MPTERIVVRIKATDWEKLYGLAQREKLSLQTVIDGILAAAIKVMEESNGKKD